MKQAYRDDTKIKFDLLSICEDGIIISHISRRTNLSHYAALKQLNYLTRQGLIKIVTKKNDTSITPGRNGKYPITNYYWTTDLGYKAKKLLEDYYQILKENK